MELALICLVASVFFFAVGTVGSSFKLFGLAEFDGKVQNRWLKVLSLILGALFFVSFLGAFGAHSARQQGNDQGGEERREAPMNSGNPQTDDSQTRPQDPQKPWQVDILPPDHTPRPTIRPLGPGALERLKQ